MGRRPVIVRALRSIGFSLNICTHTAAMLHCAAHRISEEVMRHFVNSKTIVVVMLMAGLGCAGWLLASPAANQESLLDGYRHVEVASVSDAFEQLTGKK